MMNTPNTNLHYNVAEKGKVFALQGNHKEALRHYKEALRMCQSLPNADVFFQHYSLCAMETLEKMEAYQEVINFCDKCLDFLESKEIDKGQIVFQKYLASIIERKGIQYLYLKENKEAIDCFKEVQKCVDKKMMPLTNDLLNWTLRGFTITPKQILDAQNKYQYFTVRKDNVNPEIAIELPEMVNPY